MPAQSCVSLQAPSRRKKCANHCTAQTRNAASAAPETRSQLEAFHEALFALQTFAIYRGPETAA